MNSKMMTIFAVVATFACLVDSANVCPKDLLQKCQLEFYTTISLRPPNPPLINGAQGLQWAINSMLNTGLTGQTKLCTAYQRLFVCLGSQRSNCLSVPGFINGQNDFNNATLYTTTFRMIAARCESICELAFYKNMPCALTVNMTQASVIAKCYSDFLGSLSNDRERNCRMLKVYEVCVGKLYLTCTLDTAWCMCDQTRLSMAARFFDCAPDVTACRTSDFQS